MCRQTKFVLLVILFSRLSVVGYGATIVNGSFETPILAPDIVAAFSPGETIGEGWVVDPGSESSVLLLASGALAGPTTVDGLQHLLIGDSSLFATVWQDVALHAGDYTLGFQLAAGDAVSSGAMTVDILRGGNSVIGGPSPFAVGVGSPFQDFQLSFTAATSDTYRIQIQGISSGPIIDAFRFVTAIPEPTFAILLAYMSAPIYLTRRRRRALPR